MTHHDHAVGQQNPVLVGSSVVKLPKLIARDRLAGCRVGRVPRHDLINSDTGIVQVHATDLDLARSQVAVLDSLSEVILVDRLAEVANFVVRDLQVFECLATLLGSLRVYAASP